MVLHTKLTRSYKSKRYYFLIILNDNWQSEILYLLLRRGYKIWFLYNKFDDFNAFT